MASLAKKVGYLRGLMEGLQLDANDPKSKLLGGIVDLLTDLCDHTDEIDEMLDELNDYVESIDDDLSELEGARDDEDDDEAFDFLHDDDDDDFAVNRFGSEDQLHLLSSDDDEDEALEGGICPECGGISFITAENGLNAKYVCPHCKKKVVLLPLLGDNTPIATPVDED